MRLNLKAATALAAAAVVMLASGAEPTAAQVRDGQ